MTIDLSTTYLGMKLESPFVASACPLTGRLDSLKALERAGTPVEHIRRLASSDPLDCDPAGSSQRLNRGNGWHSSRVGCSQSDAGGCGRLANRIGAAEPRHGAPNTDPKGIGPMDDRP